MTEPRWKSAYHQAIEEGRSEYEDPETGYRVFTELFHLRRGRCCGSSCRHCPFGHESVADGPSSRRSWAPTWLHAGLLARGTAVDVVFWSGGKDSWLAWNAVRKSGRSSIWLTTYDPKRDIVPVQEIAVATLDRQSARAGQPLLLQPVGADGDYRGQVLSALDTIARRHRVERLVFGDLWLTDVRAAREELYRDWAVRHGATLWFPLWKVPVEALLEELLHEGPRVRISAAEVPGVHPGELFDRELVRRLPPGVDPMGERGEFHTIVDVTGSAWEGQSRPTACRTSRRTDARG